MRDGDFECAQCRTKLNASDLNCWRCGSRNLTDMRPSRIGAGPFNVPIKHEGLGGPGAGMKPVNFGPFVPTKDGALLPPDGMGKALEFWREAARRRQTVLEAAAQGIVSVEWARDRLREDDERLGLNLERRFFRGRQWK